MLELWILRKLRSRLSILEPFRVILFKPFDRWNPSNFLLAAVTSVAVPVACGNFSCILSEASTICFESEKRQRVNPVTYLHHEKHLETFFTAKVHSRLQSSPDMFLSMISAHLSYQRSGEKTPASSNLSAIKAWKGSMTTSRSNCLGLQIMHFTAKRICQTWTVELYKYIYTRPYQTSNNFERSMISRGTGIKVSPHFQPAIMCNQKHKVWMQSGHQSCFLPKKTLYHNTLLWPLLQGLTICLKLTSKKTSQQLISTNGKANSRSVNLLFLVGHF